MIIKVLGIIFFSWFSCFGFKNVGFFKFVVSILLGMDEKKVCVIWNCFLLLLLNVVENIVCLYVGLNC